jgi:hypothetical protein
MIIQPCKIKLQRSILILPEFQGDFDVALSFDNCLVVDEGNKLIIIDDEGHIQTLNITLVEEDFTTFSYLGKFRSGNQFRLVKPRNYEDTSLIRKYGGINSFTIGSLSPNGYAVTYILFDTDEDFSINVVEAGIDEQLNKLVDMTSQMIDHNLEHLYVYFAKQILELLNVSGDFKNKSITFFKVINHMSINLELFSEVERDLIRKFKS